MKNDNHNIKQTIKQFKQELCQEFTKSTNIRSLTRKLALFIDKQLQILFNKNNLHDLNNFCLLALGSYGRRELQLHSDIDILLVHSENINKEEESKAQQFVQDCWDVGLEVSHQITTVSACADLASRDVSVISSIMDSHLICGAGALMEELSFQTQPVQMWPPAEYFQAKEKEQNQRYAKYGETAYNLEPNIKFGPGGLRDLQLLLSISKRQFNIKTFAEGISFGIFTEKEYDELMDCEHFLWRVRFALHMLADKAEERLSFDYQLQLAKFFGYEDKPHSLAIEQFMKSYFKVIKRNRELIEMLMQWFEEIIIQEQQNSIEHLDNEFQLFNHYLEVRHAKVFVQEPQALLRLFLWLIKRSDIQGVRANTIRLIRQSLYLIDDNFKNAPESIDCFMNILMQKRPPFKALQKMNRYGVLGHYLDCFAAVTGQMQYDLFHAYTVDQHTLFVVRNLSRFTQEQYAKQFPLCHSIMKNLEKPYIAYLSALFHDIAKGQGGDHSELGAIEAQNFAKRHKLSEADMDLLVWLVRNHLIMSHTAQRKDIYDPKTIEQFCSQLPHPGYLDYLYLLTIADICATNPNLWNAWKDSLLKELYKAAHLKFQQKQELIDATTVIAARKQAALSLLINEGVSKKSVEDLWSQFKGKYFLHESPEAIAYHSKEIIKCMHFPLVLILPHHSQGGTEVFIYMPHRDERFTIATSVLANHHVTIQEAVILTCNNQFDLDIYIILDENNQVFLDTQRTTAIQKALTLHLSNKSALPMVTRKRLSRALAHFKVPTQITYTDDVQKQQTQMFLVTGDRSGLLAAISRVLLKLNIHLHNAKISTMGERAEDTFYITSQHGGLLSQDEKDMLRLELIGQLDGS